MTAAAATTTTALAQEPVDSLADVYGDLDELVIVAKKDLIKSDGAKLTYDMEQDDSAKGQNLLDALRKIPMVTVDGQDNVYVKGSQNFKIYVNGKEDPMLTANYQKVFKAMSADMVSKVEVITEPGAKYDAEGTGGIINLVTERTQRKDGYTGSVSLSGTSQNFGASLYGRAKYNKVTADASVNYADNSLQKQESLAYMELLDESSDNNYRQVTENSQSFIFSYLGASLNLSWEPTDKDLFTVGGDVNWLDANVDRFRMTNSMYNRAGALIWKTLQNTTGTLVNLGASGNASYRRLLDDKGQKLTAAYRFNFGSNRIALDYANENEVGDAGLAPYERNVNSVFQREHTATLDYVLPLSSDKHTIEAGAKGVFRRNASGTERSLGLTSDALTPVAGDDGRTDQIQDIYAVYASYTGKYNKVSVTGGVRYEHTYMGLDFPVGSEHSNFRRHLNDVTPNAAVTYMFGPASNVRLAYQMRINRPRVNQMDPTVFQMTQTFANVGNPDLRSERYNSMSLSYSNYGGAFGGSVTLSYGQADNSIEQYEYIENGISYSTYANIGHTRRTDLTANFNWTINQRMMLGASGGVSYTDLNAGSHGLHNSGWSGNYNVNYSYRGPWDVKYTLYGGQSLRNVSLQGHNSGWYYYGLSIGKGFLKDDALNVVIQAGNFFTKYTRYKSTSNYDSYTRHNLYRNRSWNVGVTVSWNFGKLQDRVKTTDANLDNNDTKSTGSKQGIGL